MIIDSKKYAGRAQVYDTMGNRLLAVTSFNTDTNEVEMALLVASNEKTQTGAFIVGLNEKGKPEIFTLKFILPGAYVVVDGNKIEGAVKNAKPKT